METPLVADIERPSFDELFMYRAFVSGARTTCLKRGVGAVLARNNREIASGYNGAPPGITSCLDLKYCYYERMADEEAGPNEAYFERLKEEYKKYCIAVHAEANALAQCSGTGIEARGATLYVTTLPCPGCTRDHVLAPKIARVVYGLEYLSNDLLKHDEARETMRLLLGANVPCVHLELSSKRMKEIHTLASNVGTRGGYRYERVSG